MSKGLVLVTGANGYIAARTVEAFLAAGYAVRGTVRALSSAEPLIAALEPSHRENLTFVAVPNITAPGAFDEAAQGVTAIAHLAAPVSLSFTDPEPVMRDAVDGTLRVLESAQKSPSVKSFVFMSSIAAVAQNREDDHVYTEKDWNDFAEDLVKQMGKKTPSGVIYYASKTAAERVLWKFRDEKKPKFTLTSINPTFVAGPPLVVPSSTDKLGETYRLAADVYMGVPLEKAGIPGSFHGYSDVRDVARLVVFGVEHADKANNERYIVSAAYSPPQAVADILRKRYPDRRNIIEEGTPGQGYNADYSYPKEKVYDGSKAVRATIQAYIPWEKTVVDTVEQLKPILA